MGSKKKVIPLVTEPAPAGILSVESQAAAETAAPEQTSQLSPMEEHAVERLADIHGSALTPLHILQAGDKRPFHEEFVSPALVGDAPAVQSETSVTDPAKETEIVFSDLDGVVDSVSVKTGLTGDELHQLAHLGLIQYATEKNLHPERVNVEY
jgi:hypothetical protein